MGIVARDLQQCPPKRIAQFAHTHLEQLTENVIREAIHRDMSEATEGEAPKALAERNGG